MSFKEVGWVIKIIQNQIEQVRQQLHILISQDASYEKIYNKSVELDLLINQYYGNSSRN